MVRIKNRYLLVNILYPESPEVKSKPPPPPKRPAPIPDVVQFHQPTPDDLTPQLLARTIKDQIGLLYGDYGVGVTAGSLNVKYFSPATSTAIIRCSRAHYRLVWAALSFMTHLPSATKQSTLRPCVFQVVRVSGTIKKSEEEAIKRARAAIMRAKREAGHDATAGLLAILRQPDKDPVREGPGKKNDDAVVGIEDTDGEDEMESDSDGNG